MDGRGLCDVLSLLLPEELAKDLTEDFIELRRAVALSSAGHPAGGKFVETFAQILQYLNAGQWDEGSSLKVDRVLCDSQQWTDLDDGLRICGARLARAMYSMRSKRNMVHKGSIDPSRYDLAFLHHSAQWIVSELVRNVEGVSMDEAARLVRGVQAPVGGLVEDFGDKQLVLGRRKIREELLLLMHHSYPSGRTLEDLQESMLRSSAVSVRRVANQLWREKLVEYRGEELTLTVSGHAEISALVADEVA